MTNIFIIAGEASGDTIGARLIQSLKQKSPDAPIHGIGGEKMEQQGLHSLFPMSELSLMGFLEILPHLPNLLNRIDETVEEILRVKPDVLVTIDSPGFNFKIAKKLQGSGIRLVHYVAPTVWAYKPERAFNVAKLYDHQLLILPFEAPYFAKTGMGYTYVGHPIIEEPINKKPILDFRKKYNISKDAPLLCITAGSRKTELKRLLPIYAETISLLKESFPKLEIVAPTLTSLVSTMEQWKASVAAPVTIITDQQEKYAAYHAANAGLAKSGTNTLEMSIAKLPIVVTYKINAFSYWWIKRLATVKFVNLLNLTANKEIIPECIQGACTAEQLAANISELLTNQDTAKQQIDLSQKALKDLGLSGRQSPSDKAANVVLGY
jgi:lipid-A-disaccharide synthase